MRNILWIVALVAGAFLLSNSGLAGRGLKPQVLKFSEFKSRLAGGEIQTARVEARQFTGLLAGGGEAPKYRVVVHQLPVFRGELIEEMIEAKVEVEMHQPAISEAAQTVLLSVMLPLGLIVVLWLLFWRQAQSTSNQALSFGRSKAKRLTDSVPKVTFEDVAGVDEAKEELQEIVEFLKNPKKFQALGAKIPKGVLLLGPPGCGKTLLARAIAGEAGVPFFHISGSDFVEMFVGVGASRVRDLFDTAKANKPSLVFIDEIDAVGRQRGAGLGGGHDEREQTLNQLLVEMDGFDANAGVILLAATNRPDVLDPALLRPGRFDRRVVVDSPDRRGRLGILEVHAKGKPLADDVELDVLARRTPGFTGADLANLINEAALKAAREDKHEIEMTDFNAATDRVVAGPERHSRVISEKEKRIIAYHEVGHALVQEVLPLCDPIHKVTILPRGMALGLTWSLPVEDKYLISKSELMDDIAGLLGGRVAEEIVCGEMYTGAVNDLERATEIARRMVTECGMSERLGPLKLGHRHGNPFLGRDIMEDRNYSEDVARVIDEEVRKLVEAGYDRAHTILVDRREAMDNIVVELLERETLERDQFVALMEGKELPAEELETPTPPAAEPEPEEDASEPVTPESPTLEPRPNPA